MSGGPRTAWTLLEQASACEVHLSVSKCSRTFLTNPKGTHVQIEGFHGGFNCVDFTGWQCDPRITPLLDAFAKAPAEEDRKKIAAEIQTVMYDHARAFRGAVGPAGYRADLRGLIPSAIPIFWNIEK